VTRDPKGPHDTAIWAGQGRGFVAFPVGRTAAASVSPRSASDPRLTARVEARARKIKQRIASSATTKDWHGAPFKAYSAEIASDVLPRVRERLQTLEPELIRLGPSARALDDLESALSARLPDGRKLHLIEFRRG
jgi:hypothetical protein